MPAYFSLVLSIKKKENNKRLFKDFVGLLEDSGFRFKSGYMDCAGDTLKDIVKINTEKLLADFELASDEDMSHDYRQSMWEFGGFSEVRMFIVNFREDDYFTFEIIVPEDEVYDYDADPRYKAEAVSALKSVALALWKRKYVMAIQTCLETDSAVGPDMMLEGEKPSVKPFAIVPASYLKENRNGSFLYTNVRRKGVLIKQ